ncbi:MAG: DegT/DnrJ/EryC1/StrS aminotransferase family protein [Candidatus Aminicenantes bacterium]|nr:MAG: DegT/DnrJ/EryC1/StrS aminotransferase family protein [Candidatus Aminicenantes bacterium]
MDNEIIPHSRPSLSGQDVEAVISVIKSGQLSQGPKVTEFEKRVSEFIGKKRAVATSSGTAALHLALLALDIQKGDEVIIPSFVCSAVLNAVNYTGATPSIADIDPLTFNISVNAVKRAINSKTKAIIVPYMFGCPAEIDEFLELGIPVVEDCAQAIGADFKGRKVGSFGLMSVFSFYATKLLTSGEGGMVLSDSEDLISKIENLRDYDDRDDYTLRFNYKMMDIQASLGMSQLSSLEKFISRRREIAERYFKEFKDRNFSLPIRKEEKEHIYYRFIVKAREDASSYLEALQARKVMCRRPVYIPLHVYLNLSGFPNTMEAWQKTISIPLYPSLTEKEIKKIVDVVKEIL